MNFGALLKNRGFLIAVAVIIVLAILGFIFLGKSGNSKTTADDKKLGNSPNQQNILTTDDLGKALEIQSILAREGITTERQERGSRSIIRLTSDTTESQRDRALLTIVRSGIIDKNVGLEIFDKGDFTSSKEDKRIRLARAVNGELARLIKKIPPIEDASVFVSIPEQTIFTTMQKPVTASVQVTLPPSTEDGKPIDKLDRDKIRAITNLLIGSVQGLDAKNVTITDTNGNVYSSIISPEEDMMTLLEEKDQYMKSKVSSQLDRLLGKGNYVVTVSTYLREAPLEATKLIYNPKQSSVVSAQRFRESLGDKSSDVSKYSSAVSSYLPNGLPTGGDSASDRNYGRTAEEYQYGVGRMQVSEVRNPGMMEEISIAVTLDRAALPSGVSAKDIKELVARAASPKARAANVKIAYSDVSSPTLLSPERPYQSAIPTEAGSPLWIIIAIASGVIVVVLLMVIGRSKYASIKQQEEIDSLLERTATQDNMIKEAASQTAKLQQMQEQLQQSLVVSQAQPAMVNLHETLADIKGNIVDTADEREIAKTLRTWIESTG